MSSANGRTDARWPLSRPTQASAVLALACALALAGCSAGEKHDAAVAGHVGGGLQLAPDPAFAGAEIAATINDAGVRADRCRFEWRRNGTLMAEATSARVGSGGFARGDEIEVKVFVPASEPGGERTLTAKTRVLNSPPNVTRVTLTTATASGRAELVATPVSVDGDGDALRHRFRWLRNGAEVRGEAGAGLPLAGLAVGDQISVEVVASDGETESTPERSEAFRIENRPPQFTSQPVIPGPADLVFSYQAVATDADGDALRYELVSGPAGLTVAADGTVTWTLPARAERTGDHAIAVRAVDAKGGEAVQQFTIRLGKPVEKPW